jgi:branched-chain amino acid transport system substrate-binding protein
VKAFGAALLILCGLLGAATSAARAASPYTVYAVLPLTGTNAFAGLEERQSLEILAAAINRGDGVRGQPIAFSFGDSQSNPEIAVQLAANIVSKHVPVVIGDASTGACSAMAAQFADGPVQFCLSPGFTPKPNGFSYTIGVSPLEQTETQMRYFRARGWLKIALLVATDATGQSIRDVTARVLAEPAFHDFQLVDVEQFNPSDISVSAQITRIKASGAQAIVAFVTGTPFGTVVRGLHDAGSTLPVATSQGNLSYGELRSFGATLPDNLFFMSAPLPPFGQVIAPSGFKSAQSAYVDAFARSGIKPDLNHAVAWDTGMVVITALRALGTGATATQLRDYVNGLHDFPAVLGMLDFRDGKMRGASDIRVLRWDQSKSTWSIVAGPDGKPYG